MALRARARALTCGIRWRILATRSDWLAPIQMNEASTSGHTRSVKSRSRPPVSAVATGKITSSAASTRPPQAATMVPEPGLPESFQTPARNILPPSSGSPGSRLNTPTMRLANHSCQVSTSRMPPSLITQTSAARPMPASPSESAGPAAATMNSLPGVGGSFSISETPPRR